MRANDVGVMRKTAFSLFPDCNSLPDCYNALCIFRKDLNGRVLYGFLNVRFSKRYFLKIELIQDIEIAHRQFRLVTRS